MAEVSHEPTTGTSDEVLRRVLPLLALPIMGEDNRREWYEETNPQLKELSRSVAVMIPKKDESLEKTANGFRLTAKASTLGEFRNLCPDEKFFDQPVPGECSSFLVSPKVLATAAHCVENGCKDYHYVFDFLQKSKGKTTTSFTEDQVYSCKKVLSQSQEDDWALLELDRPVVERKSFKLRQSGEPEVGEPIMALGFPTGLPLKIDGGGKVRLADQEQPHIEADLDIFGGNSGGPIVNPETLEVQGITVMAFGEYEKSTDPKTGKPCFRPRKFDDPEEGVNPRFTRTSRFRDAVKKLAR